MKLFLSVCLCAKTFCFLRSTPFHTECERHRRRLQELRGFPPVHPPRRCGGHEQHLPQGLKHEGSRELWVKQIEFPSGRERQLSISGMYQSISALAPASPTSSTRPACLILLWPTGWSSRWRRPQRWHPAGPLGSSSTPRGGSCQCWGSRTDTPDRSSSSGSNEKAPDVSKPF